MKRANLEAEHFWATQTLEEARERLINDTRDYALVVGCRAAVIFDAYNNLDMLATTRCAVPWSDWWIPDHFYEVALLKRISANLMHMCCVAACHMHWRHVFWCCAHSIIGGGCTISISLQQRPETGVAEKPLPAKDCLCTVPNRRCISDLAVFLCLQSAICCS